MTNRRIELVSTDIVFHGAHNTKPSLLGQCPDQVLLNIAAQITSRADMNSFVCSSRQCCRAVNAFLYKFDLRNDNKRSSALVWACCLSKYETARKALAAGADPNAELPTDVRQVIEKYLPAFDPLRGSLTRNALYIVASIGDTEMANIFINSAKADFSQPVPYRSEPTRTDLLQPLRWEDPPMLAAMFRDCGELFQCFLQLYGYKVTDVSGNTTLTLSVREKRPAAIRAILRDETCTDPLGADEVNGLIQAVYQGDAGLVRLILAKSQSNPNVVRNKDDDSRCPSGIRGQTPLAVAVCHGHESIVRVLCADPRVDINLAGPNYRTPFFYAVRHAHWGIADILYERGATYDAELVFEQACVERRLDWMIRLIRVTEFNEYRLQDWYDKAYGHLKTCLYWLQVRPELDKRRETYAKNWATGQSPAVNEASDRK